MNQPFRIALSVALILGTMVFLNMRSHGDAVPLKQSFATFPLEIGEWRGQEGTILDADVLDVLRLNDYIVRRYQDEQGRSLWLYIGYWETQRKGAQIHSPKNCLPGGGWAPLEADRADIPLQGGKDIEVNRYVLQKDNAQQMALYWFDAQGQPVASEIDAKLELLKGAVLRNRTDGALVRITSPVYGNADQTFEWQAEFVRELYPVLAEYLPGKA